MVGHRGPHQHFSSPSQCHAITSPFPQRRVPGSIKIEIANGVDRNDEISQCRGWKLFLLLPRLLLSRPPRGGLIPKQQLVNRFSAFSRGEWDQLLFQSEEWGAAARKGSNGGAEHKQTPWTVEQRGPSHWF